jgi:hypothetical protein
MPPRNDEPERVNAYANLYADKKALIVLGGTSAKSWQHLYKETGADVVLGANGVNSLIPNLDFHMVIENMKRTARLANKKDPRAMHFMQMLRRTGASTRLYNHKNAALLGANVSREGLVGVQRRGSFDADKVPPDFSFREYGSGFIKGGLMKDKQAIGNLKLPIGTVALQLLHMAGILGVRQVHTIGLDLCFTPGESHHAYTYPGYMPNTYFLPANFITYKGFSTMSFWKESAEFLTAIKPCMDDVGLEWIDHSHGLLGHL